MSERALGDEEGKGPPETETANARHRGVRCSCELPSTWPELRGVEVVSGFVGRPTVPLASPLVLNVRSAATEAPWNWLEMQILGLHRGPTKSET